MRRTFQVACCLTVCLGASCAPPRAQKDTAKTGGDTKAEISKGGNVIPTPKVSQAQTDPVKEFAADFLQALAKGKAKPEQLTDELCKQLGRPRNDDEKARGFSESLVQAYLDKHSGTSFQVEDAYALTNDYSLVGVAKPGGYFVLKVVMPAGQAPKVTWFHTSPVRIGNRTSGRPVSPDMEVARDFLEVLLKGDFALAATKLTPEALEAVAPPTASDKALGYNPGMLQLKWNNWKGDNAELTPGDSVGLFSGELNKDGKKTPFELKLSQTASGWKVTDVKLKN